MQKYRENVLVSGEPVANATVTVRNRATGTLATLYSDNGVTQLANPVTTNDLGEFWFYAADGRYDLLIEKTGVAAITPLLLTDVLLEDPVDGISEVSVKSVNTLDPDSEGNVTLTTANIAEGSNLYHTVARVRAVVLTGLSLTTNAAITATDTVLSSLGKLQKQITDLIAGKDASNGYAGLTLFKLNMRNAANTFTSFLTNANTAARTYTFPDKDGTVAMTSDISSSSLVPLGSVTVGSAVNNIELLNVFPADCDKIIIEVYGVKPGANNSILRMQAAFGGVVDTAANYGGPSNSDAAQAALTTSWGIGVNSASGSAASQTSGYTIELRDVMATTRHKGIGTRGSVHGGGYAAFIAEGYHANAAAAMSGFRLFWASGATFTTGTVRVYGVKNT